VLPADPARWQREQDVLRWFANQEQMDEGRFIAILEDRAATGAEACVRQFCTALLAEWRNEPMRQFWVTVASSQ